MGGDILFVQMILKTLSKLKIRDNFIHVKSLYYGLNLKSILL